VNNLFIQTGRAEKLFVCLNRLPQIAFHYFVLSLPIIIFAITIIIKN
jgi:hypothetical protein